MDLSINNKRILNYLENKTSVEPLEELEYFFKHPDTQPCFMNDLRMRVEGATKIATKYKIESFPANTLTECLIVLSYTTSLFLDPTSSKEDRLDALKETAVSLRYMWNISKFTNQNERLR